MNTDKAFHQVARNGRGGRARWLCGALAIAFLLPMVAWGQQIVYWRSEAVSGSWWYGSPEPWWYDTWGNAQDRPDRTWRTANDIVFNNNNQTSMDLNGTDWYYVRSLTFANTATGARTINSSTAGIDMRGSGTRKIENNSAASHVFGAPISLVDGTTEFNPVSGNLTFNGIIYLANNWINVYGNNQKTLNLNGVLNANSGNGGLAVKQDSIVVVTNNNTFTGAIWVEKGTVQLGGHTNAIGASGIANVGTNATLDISGYGAVGVRPTTLNLYGTGTNAAWGALRKTSSGATAWRGNINLGADSKIVVTAGGIGLYGTIDASSHTLYITNTTAITMFSGSTLSGSKTSGDGALHKSGSSILHLRPASGLTGSIWLNQGEIRQYTDNSSTIPAGGIFRMSAGTIYRSDGTSRINAKATQIDGNVTLGHSGGGELTLSGNMNLTAGQRTLTTDCDIAISGAVTNGGLTKAGSGKLTLSGANTYALGTLVSAGTLEGTTTSLQGNITNNSAVIINQAGAGTYAGVLSGTGTLTKQGAGTVTLSGANTYSGNTTVSSGTLLVSGSANNSAVTVSSGATLAGAGSVGGLTVNGMVSPGNSSGARATLNCGALTLGSGGGYTFDISNVSGSAGTDWDLVSGSGVLTVNAAGTFTIYATGNPTGFDSGASYTWTIMSGSSVSGFNAARFAVDTSSFTPGLDGGTFSVANSGANLQLVFTPAPPPTPAGFSASDGTSTAHVALSWTDGARETGYVIWRHTADVPASATAIFTNAANTTTYNDTSAAEGQLYYYWVSATNTGGSSAKSTVDTGYRKLATVGSVAATDGTHLDKVVVSWTDITGETGYGIWRDTDSDPAGGAWAGTAAANATSFDDTTATPGQLYYYWVRATNSTSSSMSDYQVAGEPGYRKLPTVAGVAATDNSAAHIQVTWTDSNAGETGYTVWRNTADNSGGAAIVSGAALGADATSYNDTTATAGVDYWYWVRATNSTSTSMSDFSASAQGLRLLSQPTTAASSITFSSLGTTSYTVGWTRGNGDYVLVVAKEGSAPTAPTASTVYGADPNFGDGDFTAAGSFVVYKGTGTSVPVTGLSAATEYYFAVYEFNGDTTPAYRTSDAPVASRFTLATEPSTQASGITISNPIEVSMTGFNWTDGNGTSRLLVMKAGGPVDSFPLDGTGYTHSTNFGSGSQIGTGNYVVWSGAGQPDRISSLTRDVVYHFRLFEFNGSGATANYNTNTASGNPISQTTMASIPTGSPTDLTIISVTSNQFTISWTKGVNGTNTLVVLRVGATNNANPPNMTTYAASDSFGAGSGLGGGFVVYNGTGSSVTVTNLTPGTLYFAKAYAFNGSPGAENYRLTGHPSTNASTLMSEPSQATSISFSALGSTAYQVSYTAGSGLNRLVVAKQGSAVDWFPADATAYTGENNSIGSATDLGGGNYLVHRGASPFTLSGLSAQTAYHVRIYEYQGTNTTLNYNTNAASGNPASRYTLSTEPAAHAAPFTATAASDTAIDLAWGAATGESGFIIVRRAGAAPTGTPADGTAYSQGNALGDGTVVFVNTTAGANSHTDSYSTSADTTYYYRIYPYAYDGTPANATYNYYTGGTIPTANATTGKSEPATSSSITSFLPASGTSATIVWTNTGSAEGTLILVKSGGAVDSNPADWNSYTANAAFGSGQELGTSNFVVFAAAGKHGSVTVTGLTAGTTYHAAVYPYNGSGSFLNYRTNSPGTASVTILPNPSAATATLDGKTMIRLAWAKHASYNVMIVHRAGAPSTAPTQGTGYNAGDAVGGGTVIYKGGAAVLEHVVASGTAHHYAFYSYSGANFYSAGLTDSKSTTSFASGEIVETFSYTNDVSLSGLNGETGWSGAWTADSGTWVIKTNHGSATVPLFQNMPDYPTNSGNRVRLNNPGHNGSGSATRAFPAISTGKVYMAAILSYQFSGTRKWAGFQFMSNTTERVFVGKAYDATENTKLAIDEGGAKTFSASYDLNPFAGGGGDTGNVYLVVARYDFDTRALDVKAYYQSLAVDDEEPGSWDVSRTLTAGYMNSVSGIRIKAGAADGASDHTIGDVFYDEIRVAGSWSDLIGVLPTSPDDPSGQSATADGNEMVRLAWTKNGAGSDVMILHKTTAITTDPTDGTGYNAGDTIDGARVIYKGGATRLEHVVTPGTTNYYKFYSYSTANYYSDGVTDDVSVGSYAAYERLDTFSYTNDTAFGTSMIGGQGFGINYWVQGGDGDWNARTNNAVAAADTPKFFDMDGYPPMAGNLAYVSGLGDNQKGYAERDLASGITTGNFYVAFMMSYQYYGADKWAGLSLMNGGTEKAFFGKGSGANWHTLAAAAGASTYWSAFDLLPFHSTGGNTGNVYMIVGHYNFESRVLRTKAWRVLDNEFPEDEPSSWDASGTLGTGIDAINRIRLNVGSDDAGGTIGRVFFDEIRYGTSWSDLLAVQCPTWAGSNTLNGAEWAAPASTWLGDFEGFSFQSWPVSVGQSGGIEFDWGRDGSFSTYQDLPWLQNANNNTYWSNQLQMVTTGVITSRFVAAGSGCAEVRTSNPALTVQNLNAPTDATATRDGINTNSQINLEWVRGVSGGAKDVLVVRQTADSGWTTPVNGTTYNGGDSLGSGTVVYRGSGTSASDAGLAPNTTYYYRFYSENWTYFSTNIVAANASTAPGSQVIVIDGNPADWLGSPSTVLNNSASSLQEYIWTDKRGDVRTDHADHQNADITEFRVYADATWVYFLVKMTNITDVSKPYVAIGVDTRTNPASSSMNWLGDDANTFMGSGYFGDGGAVHFPEYQINVHHIDATTRIEMYAHDGNSWYAPPTGGNEEVAISTTYNAVELRVARADLNLTGAKTARFTVASYLNSGTWNNEGAGTVNLTDGTARAADSISIPPWNAPDNDARMSAWLEDISDGDIDFWFDVKFGASSLLNNSRPSTPVLVSPTNTAATVASPNLVWNSSTDSDGQVTGYLLEISTNAQFNGVSGTENGAISLRVNLDATTTNYTFTTTATQYWWRVRARDTAGELSAATTRVFNVVGKLDTEGPRPTLLYIGTNVAGYLAGDYNAHIAQYGPIQDVWDSEISDTNNVFGFVLRWEDPSGVYVTNVMRAGDGSPNPGGFAWNIVDTHGRVSPNWDLVEIDTVNGTTNEWGKDLPFYATNTMATGNNDSVATNYVHAAFSMTNYNPAIEYYLTVSAEDGYTEGGSWWTYGSWDSYAASSSGTYSGWCADGPNTARNITTNFLIRIHVRDDDTIPPAPSRALGWEHDASMVVSNAAGRLDRLEGTGQDILYSITDGDLIGEPLSFSFNVYDPYFKGIAVGTSETYEEHGRTLTNTAFVAAYWQTNWSNFSAARSLDSDTTDPETMLTWHWPTITTQDVTKLWGPDSLSGELGVTNLIQLDLFDVDNDREGDQASIRQNFGRIVLIDDDSVPPVIDTGSLQVTGTGLASEYRLVNLVVWDFTGASGDPNKLVSTNVAAGVTSSPVSLGPSGSISGTDVITVSAGFATGADRFWLFSLTPASTSETFKATSISFDSRVSSLNGPDRWELYGTMPGGVETLWAQGDIDLSDPDNPIGTNWNGYSEGLAMPAAATNTVQFKLRAYVADTNHLTGTGTATWSVDNLTLSGYILGAAGGTQVTDRDLAQGTVRFQALMHDAYSGLYASTQSGRAPRVDFWFANGVPVTNAFFTNGLAGNGSATTPTTVWGYAPAAGKQSIQGGRVPTNYTARFKAEDYDTDRDGDSLVTTNTLANIPVYDNDTNAPARGFKYGSPLGVFVDNTITKAVSSGFTREYRITDEQLQAMTATSITVKVNLYDFSGWEVPTLTFSNAAAGLISTNGWLSGLHTTSVNTTNNPDAEMVWTLSKDQATTFFSSYESVVNVFRVGSVWDKDNDRHDSGGNNIDRLQLANARIGHLTFIDNDVGLPNLQSSWSVARTNWNIPKIYLGLPGDAGASNVLINADVALPNTNAAASLAILTNRVYDSQLAKVSADAPLSVVLPTFDTGGGGAGRTVKGVQRGTVLTQESVNTGYNITNSWIGIGTVRVQNASAYRSDLSSTIADTRIAARFPTSTWAFTEFSYEQVGHFLNAGETSMGHAMTSGLFDADDNRPNDQTFREVAFGTLLVLDNDTVPPVAPSNVTVNGIDTSGGLDRFSAPWTNQPEFRVSFVPSVDGDPVGTDLEATGVGEHRVATSKSNIGPDLGTPLAVPAEGALANSGFEHGALGWTLTGAEISQEQAYEGTNSLKMIASTAHQTVQLVNTNAHAPRVTVLGAQYMGAGNGTLTVAGLDANGDPIGGESFDVVIIGSAGQWGGGSEIPQTLATTVDQIRVTLASAAGTYWDDIHIQIEMLDGATPVDEVTSIFNATEQGLVTNYLFAVDRDNNRPGDRLASSAPADPDIPAFITAYDITPPTLVPMPANAASTETVDDPTTQFDIEWTTAGVGPDDEGDANYPSGYSGTDVLSPWRTYKVYYGAFDPVDVPSGDPGHGNGNAYIYTNFIATGAYTNWTSIASTNAIQDPSAAGTNYLALTNLSQNAIRLYDLDFDQDYAVVIVGVDRAGNEGAAGPESWATNNTIRFAVTQGVMRSRAQIEVAFPTNNNLRTGDKGAAGLFWIAAGPTNAQGGYTQVNKEYDLIYYDSGFFNETATTVWRRVGTVQSNWFTDAEAQDFGRGTLRFYRASYKDRWRRTNVVSGLPQRPLASEDVYALHNVVISEGYNHVSLHGLPFTNTFAGVFGTDTNFWPAGASAGAGATKVEFYAPGSNAPVSEVYFFGIDGNWYQAGNPTPVTSALQSSNFFMRGFSLTLPKPLPTNYVTTMAYDFDNATNVAAMVWRPILKVPTTNGPAGGGFSHTIHCGQRRPNLVSMYNVVALNLPVSAHPSQMNLLESGFVKEDGAQGDLIYTLDTSQKKMRDGSTIYCDDAGVWRFFVGGGTVPAGYFKPNDMIVIWSFRGGVGNTWNWTYHPTNFYTLPTRWMGE